MDNVKAVFDRDVTIDQMSQTITKMEDEKILNVSEIKRLRESIMNISNLTDSVNMNSIREEYQYVINEIIGICTEH